MLINTRASSFKFCNLVIDVVKLSSFSLRKRETKKECNSVNNNKPSYTRIVPFDEPPKKNISVKTNEYCSKKKERKKEKEMNTSMFIFSGLRIWGTLIFHHQEKKKNQDVTKQLAENVKVYAGNCFYFLNKYIYIYIIFMFIIIFIIYIPTRIFFKNLWLW